jgi:hypothetical protein
MTDDDRCCGTGTCIINEDGCCWCGQQWDGEKMCFPKTGAALEKVITVDSDPSTNDGTSSPIADVLD